MDISEIHFLNLEEKVPNIVAGHLVIVRPTIETRMYGKLQDKVLFGLRGPLQVWRDAVGSTLPVPIGTCKRLVRDINESGFFGAHTIKNPKILNDSVPKETQTARFKARLLFADEKSPGTSRRLEIILERCMVHF